MRTSVGNWRCLPPWVALAAAVGGAGCSTLRVEKSPVESVNHVALIGFGLSQQQPNTVLGVLSGAGEAEIKGPVGMRMTGANIAEESAHATRMYEALSTTLGKSMSWKVMARSALGNNLLYHRLLESTTQGFQSRPMSSERNMTAFRPEGIAEAYLLRAMSLQERGELMRSLGVNGVVVADVRVVLEDHGGMKKLIGAGDFKPRAVLTFQLFDATREEAIWHDTWASGDPTEQSVEHGLGFASVDKLNDLSVLAADSAYRKLIARYLNQVTQEK